MLYIDSVVARGSREPAPEPNEILRNPEERLRVLSPAYYKHEGGRGNCGGCSGDCGGSGSYVSGIHEYSGCGCRGHKSDDESGGLGGIIFPTSKNKYENIRERIILCGRRIT